METSTIAAISSARVMNAAAEKEQVADAGMEKAEKAAQGNDAELRHIRKYDVYEPEGNALAPGSTGIYDAFARDHSQNAEKPLQEETSEKPGKADEEASLEALRENREKSGDQEKDENEDPVVGQLGMTVGELYCDREEHKRNPKLHNQFECKKRIISTSIRPLRRSEAGKY